MNGEDRHSKPPPCELPQSSQDYWNPKGEDSCEDQPVPTLAGDPIMVKVVVRTVPCESQPVEAREDYPHLVHVNGEKSRHFW